MADLTIPPWISRDYDPVGTFMRAYQTGAQISEAQTRLAEQQRQANMEAQARQEQLQSNMLRAMTETAVQKAYQDQSISLHQQQLAETKARNDELAQKAAADVAERIRHNQMLEALRLAEVTRQAAQPEEIEVGGVPLLWSPETGRFERKEKIPTRPSIGEQAAKTVWETEYKQTAKDLATARKQQADELLPMTQREEIRTNTIPALIDQYKSLTARTNAPLPNLPPPVPLGPQTGRSNSDALRAEAENAIARGAPRDKVAARFKELTGQTL